MLTDHTYHVHSSLEQGDNASATSRTWAVRISADHHRFCPEPSRRYALKMFTESVQVVSETFANQSCVPHLPLTTCAHDRALLASKSGLGQEKLNENADFTVHHLLSVCSYLPKEQDWLKIKPFFKRLYVDQRQTLDAVIEEFYHGLNFRASKQMFQKRVAQWGYGRNLKQNEVEHSLGLLA